MFIAENLKDYSHENYSHSSLRHPEITSNNLTYFIYVYVYMCLDYIRVTLHASAYAHIITYVCIIKHSWGRAVLIFRRPP